MDNVTYLTDRDGNEHAIIDRGNEEYTSMPKSAYDEMIEAQEVAQAFYIINETISEETQEGEE
jgi:hypothetical protein